MSRYRKGIINMTTTYVTRDEFNEFVKSGTLDEYVGHVAYDASNVNLLDLLNKEYVNEIRVFIVDDKQMAKSVA